MSQLLRTLLGAVLLLCALCGAALAQAPQSPPSAFGPSAQRQAPPSAFGGAKSGDAGRAARPQVAPPKNAGLFPAFQAWVINTQRQLIQPIADAIKKLKSGDAWGAGLLLVGFSFIYGIVHAAGPGHGKAIISSYVLANRETVRRGVLISFLAAAVQGFMALFLVGVLIIALKGTGLQVNAWVKQLETASYALVFLVGLSLLVSTLRKIWRGYRDRGENHSHHRSHDHDHRHERHQHEHSADHEHSHAHDHHHHHHDHGDCEACGHIVNIDDIAQPMTWRKIFAVVFSVGIRPCSGAIFVLVFALAQGLFWAGVASTFAMAFGTAITVSILSALAIGSRKVALSFGGENSRWAEIVWLTCSIGGALLVMTIGLLLFLASLGPTRPF